jgi:peptidoglycan/xylan/chitin deacetylase (PgdA/CDA1 family)
VGFAIVAGANLSTRDLVAIVAVLLAGLAGAAATERIAGGWALTVIGGLVAVVSVWLLRQRDDLAAALILAALFAMAVSLVVHSRPLKSDAPKTRGGAVFAALLLVVTLVLTAYIGAETPAASWFGGGATHGPTNTRRVALTFDDGPDAVSTPEIMAILDRYGVKATFFQVGKAIDAAPEVTRALYRDSQLLGNHSYHHDQWRWLDPRYPELQRTQNAFKRTIGTCPVLYRPPHGDRTPFLARVVRDHDMRMVLWNVSAGDWATKDAQLVADRTLRGARPGAILLLHDGLDGKPNVKRDVLVRALPLILDGLRAKGLEPVRLDTLLGTADYQPC